MESQKKDTKQKHKRSSKFTTRTVGGGANIYKANAGTFTGTRISFYDLFTTKYYFILL